MGTSCKVTTVTGTTVSATDVKATTITATTLSATDLSGTLVYADTSLTGSTATSGCRTILVANAGGSATIGSQVVTANAFLSIFKGATQYYTPMFLTVTAS